MISLKEDSLSMEYIEELQRIYNRFEKYFEDNRLELFCDNLMKSTYKDIQKIDGFCLKQRHHATYLEVNKVDYVYAKEFHNDIMTYQAEDVLPLFGWINSCLHTAFNFYLQWFRSLVHIDDYPSHSDKVVLSVDTVKKPLIFKIMREYKEVFLINCESVIGGNIYV